MAAKALLPTTPYSVIEKHNSLSHDTFGASVVLLHSLEFPNVSDKSAGDGEIASIPCTL